MLAGPQLLVRREGFDRLKPLTIYCARDFWREWARFPDHTTSGT